MRTLVALARVSITAFWFISRWALGSVVLWAVGSHHECDCILPGLFHSAVEELDKVAGRDRTAERALVGRF